MQHLNFRLRNEILNFAGLWVSAILLQFHFLAGFIVKSKEIACLNIYDWYIQSNPSSFLYHRLTILKILQ
jgi:hypothetical protein